MDLKSSFEETKQEMLNGAVAIERTNTAQIAVARVGEPVLHSGLFFGSQTFRFPDIFLPLTQKFNLPFYQRLQTTTM